MASTDQYHHLKGHKTGGLGVSGNNPSHTDVRAHAGGKSKMKPDHPTLKPNNSFQERGQSGTDVAKPPVLDLP